MRVEVLQDAVIIRAGMGEWYNQRIWGMLDDTGLPPAQWHGEMDDAIRSCNTQPSVVVIDVREVAWIRLVDYAFFMKLSERLRLASVKLAVLARPNEVAAFARLRLRNA